MKTTQTKAETREDGVEGTETVKADKVVEVLRAKVELLRATEVEKGVDDGKAD